MELVTYMSFITGHVSNNDYNDKIKKVKRCSIEECQILMNYHPECYEHTDNVKTIVEKYKNATDIICEYPDYIKDSKLGIVDQKLCKKLDENNNTVFVHLREYGDGYICDVSHDINNFDYSFDYCKHTRNIMFTWLAILLCMYAVKSINNK